MMYTFDSRVRYSEVDEQGDITVCSIIDYMQDCTNFQTEDLGIGVVWHKEHALMWVLTFWQILFKRYPKMGERISVGTQAYGFEKMFGYRNFLITDEREETVAIANSNWVLMDLKKNRPRIVTPDIADIYGKAEPLPMEYAERKIRLPEGGEKKETLVVRDYHLDMNHHVNNRGYVQMAMEFIPGNILIKELRVEYKKQAVLGDEMWPVVFRAEKNEIIVSLENAEGKPYAIVQFFI